jgi:TusA-related sulfurtransferase
VGTLTLDLRGIRCPLTWARAKTRLADLPRGTTCVLIVDDPRSARDVPRAAEADGYAVDAIEPDGSAWRITIEA